MSDRAWEPREEAFLIQCVGCKFTAKDLEPILERTKGAIAAKRYRMNLSSPREDKSGFSVALIKRVVAEHFSLTVDDMAAANRQRVVARPRQVAMFFARDIARRSYPRIGELFGRDHTTVIHGVRQVKRLMAEDHNFKDEVSTLRSQLVSKEQTQNATYPQNKALTHNFVPFMLSPASA